MAEYITREAAIAYIRERSEEWQKAFEELGGESGIYADAYNDLAEDFYRIPTADVAPVVHARWIDDGRGIIICPECKRGYNLHAKYTHYCPNCGAKMDGGDSDAAAAFAENCGATFVAKKLRDSTAFPEVVTRCKDCAHYDMGACLKIYSDGDVHSAAWQERRPDDFCSYGEPKEV